MYLMKLASIAISAAVIQSPLTEVKRLSDEPILTPRANLFDELATYNPTALMIGKKRFLLYRAPKTRRAPSKIGYAESADGIHFVQSKEPVLVPETDYEKDGGIEDPRIVKINNLYYLTYTGYNKTDAQLCLATSKDLKKWDRLGIIMPANKGTWNEKWTKSGAILTTKAEAANIGMYYLGIRQWVPTNGRRNLYRFEALAGCD